MESTPKVVVYGASGYTGKLICWKLAERGIPFVAAGRSMKKHRHLPEDEQEKACNRIGNELVAEEPGREDPDVNRCVVSCHARGNVRSATVVLRGNSPYIQTGGLAAEACRRILAGRLRTAGFASPASAFGARELVAALAEDGLHTWVESED